MSDNYEPKPERPILIAGDQVLGVEADKRVHQYRMILDFSVDEGITSLSLQDLAAALVPVLPAGAQVDHMQVFTKREVD